MEAELRYRHRCELPSLVATRGCGGLQERRQRSAHVLAAENPVVSDARRLDQLRSAPVATWSASLIGTEWSCGSCRTLTVTCGAESKSPDVPVRYWNAVAAVQLFGDQIRHTAGSRRSAAHLSRTPDHGACRCQHQQRSHPVSTRPGSRRLPPRSPTANARQRSRMLGKRCSTASTASTYSLIVACEPGDAPCPGASKHSTDSPCATATSTTADIVVLSVPQPCRASTRGSSSPHR